MHWRQLRQWHARKVLKRLAIPQEFVQKNNYLLEWVSKNLVIFLSRRSLPFLRYARHYLVMGNVNMCTVFVTDSPW